VQKTLGLVNTHRMMNNNMMPRNSVLLKRHVSRRLVLPRNYVLLKKKRLRRLVLPMNYVLLTKKRLRRLVLLLLLLLLKKKNRVRLVSPRNRNTVQKSKHVLRRPTMRKRRWLVSLRSSVLKQLVPKRAVLLKRRVLPMKPVLLLLKKKHALKRLALPTDSVLLLLKKHVLRRHGLPGKSVQKQHVSKQLVLPRNAVQRNKRVLRRPVLLKRTVLTLLKKHVYILSERHALTRTSPPQSKASLRWRFLRCLPLREHLPANTGLSGRQLP
jgi:hypothetical protein